MKKYVLKKDLLIDRSEMGAMMYTCKNYKYLDNVKKVKVYGYALGKDGKMPRSGFGEAGLDFYIEKYGCKRITNSTMLIKPNHNMKFQTIRDEEERINPEHLILITDKIGKMSVYSTEWSMSPRYYMFYNVIDITFKTEKEKLDFLNENFTEITKEQTKMDQTIEEQSFERE